MQIPDDIKKGELVFLLDKDYNEVLDTDPKKLIGILGKFNQFATGRVPNDYIFLETPLEVRPPVDIGGGPGANLTYCESKNLTLFKLEFYKLLEVGQNALEEFFNHRQEWSPYVDFVKSYYDKFKA